MWEQLVRDLNQWLKTFATGEIEYRNPYQAIKGFPFKGFRSDGMLTNGKVLIAIEVESGQTHPDTNTGKYWLLHQHMSKSQKPYEKIVLIHIYTPNFDSYGWRKNLAEFYIEKMKAEVPIEYIQFDFRNATDYHQALREIKGKIEEEIKRLLLG